MCVRRVVWIVKERSLIRYDKADCRWPDTLNDFRRHGHREGTPDGSSLRECTELVAIQADDEESFSAYGLDENLQVSRGQGVTAG